MIELKVMTKSQSKKFNTIKDCLNYLNCLEKIGIETKCSLICIKALDKKEFEIYKSDTENFKTKTKEERNCDNQYIKNNIKNLVNILKGNVYER